MPPETFFKTHFVDVRPRLGVDTSHQAEIFLRSELGFGGFVEGGGGDDFEEKFVHFFGGLGVDGAIHADDAAEG